MVASIALQIYNTETNPIDGTIQLNSQIMQCLQKSLLENTDGDLFIDIIDGDQDNDGIVNDLDSEAESATPDGKPDWWCDKHPGKC